VELPSRSIIRRGAGAASRLNVSPSPRSTSAGSRTANQRSDPKPCRVAAKAAEPNVGAASERVGRCIARLVATAVGASAGAGIATGAGGTSAARTGACEAAGTRRVRGVPAERATRDGEAAHAAAADGLALATPGGAASLGAFDAVAAGTVAAGAAGARTAGAGAAGAGTAAAGTGADVTATGTTGAVPVTIGAATATRGCEKTRGIEP
jgi:hypothetical protein